MDAEKVLAIVLREIRAYGLGWRMDWADFDGRTLRAQLYSLADWADGASHDSHGKEYDYVEGTEFERRQST